MCSTVNETQEVALLMRFEVCTVTAFCVDDMHIISSTALTSVS